MKLISRLQVRCIVNSSLICMFAGAVSLLIMPAFLGRGLGHDYSGAYYILKDLDASIPMQIILPVTVYILLAGLLTAYYKMLLSHRIAGPLSRLEKCVGSIGRGDLDFSTVLRSGDQLDRLAVSLEELRKFLDQPFQSAEARLGRIEDLLNTLSKNCGAGKDTPSLACLTELEKEMQGLLEDFGMPGRDVRRESLSGTTLPSGDAPGKKTVECAAEKDLKSFKAA